MTDDFDKRPPDDEPDDDLDWLRGSSDDDSSVPRSDDNLGFTGELSWRQELDDRFNDQLSAVGDDQTPDWQQPDDTSEPRPTKGGSLGFTGELDWLRASGQTGDDSSPILDDTPEWLQDDAQPLESAPTDAGVPGWLGDTPAAEPEPEAVDAAVPDWLARMDLAQGTPAYDAADDDGFDDPLDWLQQDDFGDDDPAVAADDAVPDWMKDLGVGQASDALPPEASPATLPDAEALDWLQEFAAEPQAAEDEVPPSPPATEHQADAVPDWLSAVYEADSQAAIPDDATNEPVAAAWLDDGETGGETIEGAPDVDLPAWLLDNAPTDASDELFGEFDTGILREAAEADFPAQAVPEPPPGEPVPKGRITDWLEQESQAAAAKLEQDDFLDTLPQFSTSTGEFPVVPDAVTDADTSWMNIDSGEPEPFDAADGVPDWLAELQQQGDAAAEPTMQLPAQGEFDLPSDDDLFGGLDQPSAAEPAAAAGTGDFFNTGELRNIDDILSSYQNIETRVTDQTGQLVNQGDFDIESMDSLLSSAELNKLNELRKPETQAAENAGLTLESADWLSDLGVSVGSDDVSAAAIVRKQAQNERALDELPDALKALHAAGLELPAPTTEEAPDAVKALLIGVPEMIAPAPMRTGKPGLAETLILSPAQREKVSLLQSLAATDDDDGKPQLSAIDVTLDDAPDLDDIAGAGAAVKTAAAPKRAVKRTRPKLDRLLIALVLAAAVILPFVLRGLRIGQLPPVSFAAGSPQQTAFDRLAVLQPGDTVLVAAEYGLTDAAELDTTLDTLLRHLFARGARPVIVSTNAIGLLHAKNVLERGVVSGLDLQTGGGIVLTPGTGLNRFGRIIMSGTDYVIAPFIAGDSIGLRSFTQNVAGALAADLNGRPTNLGIGSLRDFSLIIVVGERSDDVRRWAEQVAPLAASPLLFAVSSAAGPLAQPYALSGGLLVGYKDAYTYRAILDAQAPLAPLPGATDIPTLVPTQPPTATPTPVTPTATPTITLTFTPSATPTVTATPTITQTPTITFTPTLTFTPTWTPTNIRATDLPPTWTPTTLPGGSEDIGSQGLVIQGIVNISEALNVRESPSRSGRPIASLPGRSTVQIIGRNEDGTWLQVRLEDGTEGWVSAQFIRIIEPGTGTPTPAAFYGDPNAVVDLLADSSYRPVAIRQDATPDVTATTAAPVFSAPAAAPVPAQGAVVPPTPYRDQRWYGMTLGLLAVIGIITLGAIINIVRGLLRRGRK